MTEDDIGENTGIVTGSALVEQPYARLGLTPQNASI
jgi:hypothetical protein